MTSTHMENVIPSLLDDFLDLLSGGRIFFVSRKLRVRPTLAGTTVHLGLSCVRTTRKKGGIQCEPWLQIRKTSFGDSERVTLVIGVALNSLDSAEIAIPWP